MIEALISQFIQIEDPRDPCKVEHRLLDLPVIAVCAVIAQAERFEDIALYSRCKRDWLGQFLDLPNGIPSHDTFRCVLMLIEPERFERCFLDWVRSVFRQNDMTPRQIAIDGKSVRRSFDRQRGRSPLHLVSAYVTERGLAQRASEAKRGELTVLPDLLDGLDLRGCLLSLGALACRPGIAEGITARGGDYLLALKGNQKKAHAEVRSWFESNAFALGGSLRPCFDAFDDGHGRVVRRRVFACAKVCTFTTLQDWPGLTAVLATETIRGVNSSGKVTAEIRTYLSGSRQPPEQLATAIQKHWRIENGLHWVLDVGCNEDASRVRERNAARNLALLRKIALNLARADTTLKASLKGKGKSAAWDNDFIAQLIKGSTADLMRQPCPGKRSCLVTVHRPVQMHGPGPGHPWDRRARLHPTRPDPARPSRGPLPRPTWNHPRAGEGGTSPPGMAASAARLTGAWLPDGQAELARRASDARGVFPQRYARSRSFRPCSLSDPSACG